MKNAVLCLIMMSNFVTQFSYAQTVTSPDSVALDGRGIVEKKTGNWIALKCITNSLQPQNFNDCTAFQHVLYDQKSNELKEIGPSIANDHDLQKNLKNIGKGFRVYLRKNTNLGEQRILVLAAITVLALAVPAVLTTLGPVAHPIISQALDDTLKWVLFMPLVLVDVTYGNDPTSAVMNSNQLNKPLLDKNGWNWSIKPKKVRKKIFEAYRTYIESLQ